MSHIPTGSFPSMASSQSFPISFWKGLQCDDSMPIKNKYYIYSIHLFMPLNIYLFKFLINS